MEDKLVVVLDGSRADYDAQTIEDAVAFQEQHFTSSVLMAD